MARGEGDRGRCLDVPEHERAALVTARCAGDPALHAEVEALLASAVTAVDLFEAPLLTGTALQAVLTEAEGDASAFVGRRVGCRTMRQRLPAQC
jgi:hypothetical protein